MEPYICTGGKPIGTIRWYPEGCPSKQDPDLGYWKPYADHEREKLKELGATYDEVRISESRFTLMVSPACRTDEIKYDSLHMDMNYVRYASDSESSRLLKRAEFLREVCKRENVEWLPREEKKGRPCCYGCHPEDLVDPPLNLAPCPCSCHKASEEKHSNPVCDGKHHPKSFCDCSCHREEKKCDWIDWNGKTDSEERKWDEFVKSGESKPCFKCGEPGFYRLGPKRVYCRQCWGEETDQWPDGKPKADSDATGWKAASEISKGEPVFYIGGSEREFRKALLDALTTPGVKAYAKAINDLRSRFT